MPGSEQHTEDENGEEDSGEESAGGQQFNQHAKRAEIRREMDNTPGGVKKCLTCLRTGHTQGHCHETTYEDGSPIVRCSRCGRANHTEKNCSAKYHVHGEKIPTDDESSGGSEDVDDNYTDNMSTATTKVTSNTTSSQRKKHQRNNSDASNDCTGESHHNTYKDELDDDVYDSFWGFSGVHVSNTDETSFKDDIRKTETSVQHAFNVSDGSLPWYIVLFDNQSTVNVFCCPHFLVNIRTVQRCLHLHTNTGMAIVNEVGELPGVGTVWLYRQGIANILSFHKLQEHNNFEVDYSSRKKAGAMRKSFVVESPEGNVFQFKPNEKGLYVMDCSKYFGAGKN